MRSMSFLKAMKGKEMDREQLANRTYEVFKRDGKASGDDDIEVWKAIARAEDITLIDFLCDHE